MGPPGLALAVNPGGNLFDQYPINPKNHLEGIIQEYWTSNKSEDTTLTDFLSVKSFVSPDNDCEFN
jgi:hypothetical protein